jgi:ABC-2 type transport system ATP-binding protein
MISAQGITKNFGQIEAVHDVSFEVQPGEILGFIGPNGAGKTTTMRILTGYLPASEGRAVVAGHDVFEDPMSVRKKVGYLPESPPLYTDLSIGAYLHFVAEIRGVGRRERSSRVGEVMERVGLTGWERRIIRSLSKGYRQRVGLAQAIIHDPQVLILDEPTSGLDPGQVVGIRDFISELAADRTVILSTHILSEVELLCSRAVIISKGKLAADDTIDGLREGVGAGVRYRVLLQVPESDLDGLAAQVGALEAVQRVSPQAPEEGLQVLEIKAPGDPRSVVAALAVEKGWALHALEKVQPTLEEAFLELVGTEGR